MIDPTQKESLDLEQRLKSYGHWKFEIEFEIISYSKVCKSLKRLLDAKVQDNANAWEKELPQSDLRFGRYCEYRDGVFSVEKDPFANKTFWKK